MTDVKHTTETKHRFETAQFSAVVENGNVIVWLNQKYSQTFLVPANDLSTFITFLQNIRAQS